MTYDEEQPVRWIVLIIIHFKATMDTFVEKVLTPKLIFTNFLQPYGSNKKVKSI